MFSLYTYVLSKLNDTFLVIFIWLTGLLFSYSIVCGEYPLYFFYFPSGDLEGILVKF